MTRVSLKEAYDNKDVVAQIYAIRDTAESAVETSEQAVTTANTASEHVDALVPQVEGAVENANTASASAQASAQTVAGYENRLATVESDLNAVTLRVTTAEGDIVTIQGRVTALETADGQNVKINRINDYAFGLTGEQIGTGDKQISNSNIKVFGSQAYGFICKSRWFNSETTGYNSSIPSLIFLANDDVELGRVELLSNAGVFMIRAKIRNHDGTYKQVELIRGDN